MTETESNTPYEIHIGQEYQVVKTIFNATILHALPHEPETPPYWRDMGGLDLEEGETVTYTGTAGENKMFGDVIGETPIFKVGQSIRTRRPDIAESDVLAVNPLALSNLGEFDPFAGLNGDITPKLMEMVKGNPNKSIIIRVRFKAGQERTFTFTGEKIHEIDKLKEILDKGMGRIISQAVATEVPDKP